MALGALALRCVFAACWNGRGGAAWPGGGGFVRLCPRGEAGPTRCCCCCRGNFKSGATAALESFCPLVIAFFSRGLFRNLSLILALFLVRRDQSLLKAPAKAEDDDNPEQP